MPLMPEVPAGRSMSCYGTGKDRNWRIWEPRRSNRRGYTHPTKQTPFFLSVLVYTTTSCFLVEYFYYKTYCSALIKAKVSGLSKTTKRMGELIKDISFLIWRNKGKILNTEGNSNQHYYHSQRRVKYHGSETVKSITNFAWFWTGLKYTGLSNNIEVA